MVKKYSLTFMGVHSFLAETEIYPGESHWDLCFLYSARLGKNLGRSSLFSELDFLDARTLRSRDIGRDQETILEVLGLIRK